MNLSQPDFPLNAIDVQPSCWIADCKPEST